MAERVQYRRIEFCVSGAPEEMNAVDRIVRAVRLAYDLNRHDAFGFIFRLGLTLAVERLAEFTTTESESTQA